MIESHAGEAMSGIFDENETFGFAKTADSLNFGVNNAESMLYDDGAGMFADVFASVGDREGSRVNVGINGF